MSNLKIGHGKRTNHKKGIATAKKAKRRAEAEERNAAYQKLSLEQRRARNPSKVMEK